MRQTLPLKRWVDPRRPITYGIVQAGDNVPDGVRYIRPVDMNGHHGVSEPAELLRTSHEIAAQYRRSTVRSGDIVVSIGPSFGKTMLVPHDLDGANLTQGTARVAASSTVDAGYIRWALQSLLAVAHWEAAVGGATFHALNLEPLSRTPIPDWPLETQRAIADFLDYETARIDSLVARKRDMVDLLEQRWLAAITTAVPPGGPQSPALRRAVQSAVGGSWGSDPGHGEVESLCIRGTDFDTKTLGVKVDSAPTRSFSRAELGSRQLTSGDLLIEKSGGGDAHPVGRVVQWSVDESAVPTNFAARLRPSHHVHSRYLAYAFRSAYEGGTTRAWVKQTTGIQNLDLGGLLSEKWTLPNFTTQREIAEGLDRIAHDVQAVQDLLTRQITLLEERRQALITAAVTGQLDIPGLAA